MFDLLHEGCISFEEENKRNQEKNHFCEGKFLTTYSHHLVCKFFSFFGLQYYCLLTLTTAP